MIVTESILPFTMIGSNAALDPSITTASGLKLSFIKSEPNPSPFVFTCMPSTLPLMIGEAVASAVDIPWVPSISTTIGG